MNKKNKSKSFSVTEPMGLLEFLFKAMPEKSSNKVKSILKYKLVSVDGVTTTKFDYPLRAGQTVAVAEYKPDYKSNRVKVDFPIIYEDDSIIVIDKPAGLLAIATDTEKTNTAYHIITEYVKSKSEDNRIFIVHRLDRDTSGILLFAKDEDTKNTLMDNWDKLVRFRGYCAVAEGCPDEREGTIESWLRETDSHFVFSARTPGDGKHAVTKYRVVSESQSYSLLAVNILTGRKNQIRAHLSEAGCPIAGDKKYGAKTNPIHRLALCADKLTIFLPHLDEEKTFLLPVPKAFVSCLKKDDNN